MNINSWNDLQKEVNNIIAALNNDENLKLAAAINPLLALEELGYKIKPDSIEQIEDRMRFGSKEASRLARLRSSIHKIAGKKFNIRSGEQLNSVLFNELKIEAYDDRGCLIKKEIKVRKKGDPGEDELLTYRGLHEIIDPLIEFRELDASVSPFSDKYVYRKIRNGNYGKDSNIRLSIRLKK